MNFIVKFATKKFKNKFAYDFQTKLKAYIIIIIAVIAKVMLVVVVFIPDDKQVCLTSY